jgi:hypothetical protein
MARFTPRSTVRAAAVAAAVLLLSGCEIPGIYPDPKVLQREAEAKATGGGCRHAQRGLEDCYALNPKAPRAAVFAGWKDMDQYMRENKIEGTKSVLSAPATEAEAEEQSVASGKDKATAPDPKERRGSRDKAS